MKRSSGDLFKVRLDQRRAVRGTRRPGGEVFPHQPPASSPERSYERAGNGVRRYCSGCERETKHVLWPTRGRAAIPSIRQPVEKPARGATFCEDCGQSRGAACRPSISVWSSWPRVAGEFAAAASRGNV
jgi:hypothetical protein